MREILLSVNLSDLSSSKVRDLGGESGVSLTNPSILRVEGGWLVSGRQPWYRLVQKGEFDVQSNSALADPPKPILLRLDGDFNFQTSAEMKVPGSSRVLSEFAANGLEDPRLFSADGQVHCLFSGLVAPAAELELARREAGSCSTSPLTWDDAQNTMILARLDGLSAEEFRVVDSPYGRKREKNWMPFSGTDGFRFAYSLSPLDFVVDGDRKATAGSFRVVRAGDGSRALRGWSGSSQFVFSSGSWLGVVHRAYRLMARVPFVRRFVYLHRLVTLDMNFKLSGFSRPFSFISPGVEFCSGLSICGDEVVFSFGFEDELGMVLRVDKEELQSRVGRCPGL